MVINLKARPRQRASAEGFLSSDPLCREMPLNPGRPMGRHPPSALGSLPSVALSSEQALRLYHALEPSGIVRDRKMQAVCRKVHVAKGSPSTGEVRGKDQRCLCPTANSPMDLRLAFSPSDNQKLGVGLESQIEPWLATRHQVQMPRNATGPIDAVTATISRNQAILNLERPQGHGRNKTEEYEAPGGREYRGSPSEAFNYWRRTRCSFS